MLRKILGDVFTRVRFLRPLLAYQGSPGGKSKLLAILVA